MRNFEDTNHTTIVIPFYSQKIILVHNSHS